MIQSTKTNPAAMDVPGYDSLSAVLLLAYDQAARGKGNERHANALPFSEQPMQKLIDLYGPGFALGQAGKKMQEAQRMGHAAAVRELQGAIVYIAGAIINMERKHQATAANDNAPPGVGGVLVADGRAAGQSIHDIQLKAAFKAEICCGGIPEGCFRCPHG